MPASESWPMVAAVYKDRCPAVLEAYGLDVSDPATNVFLSRTSPHNPTPVPNFVL